MYKTGCKKDLRWLCAHEARARTEMHSNNAYGKDAKREGRVTNVDSQSSLEFMLEHVPQLSKFHGHIFKLQYTCNKRQYNTLSLLWTVWVSLMNKMRCQWCEMVSQFEASGMIGREFGMYQKPWIVQNRLKRGEWNFSWFQNRRKRPEHQLKRLKKSPHSITKEEDGDSLYVSYPLDHSQALS